MRVATSGALQSSPYNVHIEAQRSGVAEMLVSRESIVDFATFHHVSHCFRAWDGETSAPGLTAPEPAANGFTHCFDAVMGMFTTIPLTHSSQSRKIYISTPAGEVNALITIHPQPFLVVSTVRGW